MGRILIAETDRFRQLLDERLDGLVSVYLFGSLSYGDFIPGYSDLDIFALFEPGLSGLELALGGAKLKNAAGEVYPFSQIDITMATVTEIDDPLGPVNPFLLKEISVANLIYGGQVTFMHPEPVLVEDSMRVAGVGLRNLRGAVTRIGRMNPPVALRFLDEMLFKSCKALLLGITGRLRSSRAETVAGVEEAFPAMNTWVFHHLLDIRKRMGLKEPVSDSPETLLAHVLTAYEDIWAKGRMPCSR
ncbi:MAG: nucleotidyltransferase domain-containing protein [Nitrospinae bacterium]|nr:nucleotidyltransferase domain-containing protein [Nitrospinota bacterium]